MMDRDRVWLRLASATPCGGRRPTTGHHVNDALPSAVLGWPFGPGLEVTITRYGSAPPTKLRRIAKRRFMPVERLRLGPRSKECAAGRARHATRACRGQGPPPC